MIAAGLIAMAAAATGIAMAGPRAGAVWQLVLLAGAAVVAVGGILLAWG